MVLALGLGLAGCQRTERETARIAPATEGNPSQEIGQFTLRETDAEGRLTWVLKAATAQVFEAEDQVHADAIHIDFYRETGELSSVLTADRGIITRRTNDMRALGNVVVRNAAGHELHTEELAYAADREKIATEAFVTMIRGRDVLTGYGLEADPDLAQGTFEIQRDVRATVRDLPAGESGEGAAGAAGPASAPADSAAPADAADTTAGVDSAAGDRDARNP